MFPQGGGDEPVQFDKHHSVGKKAVASGRLRGWQGLPRSGLFPLLQSSLAEARSQPLWTWRRKQKQNMACQKVLSGIRYCLTIHADICILLHQIGAPGS